MTLAFYMDVHVDGRVTQGLLDRGLDVLRAPEDGFDEAPDPALLDRATELKRVLVTCDKDFLVEARMRQRDGIHRHCVLDSRCCPNRPLDRRN